MNVIDYIIIALLIVVSGLIIYFCFWKNRKKPCHGCPYAKNCESANCPTKSKKSA
ncbi:MAG: hypothetical protein IKB06_02195 [Clostridia bacterium]|nr:hypothetical protein [Clostridia bacterium]MBR2391283.1 hypothetical protein [Clostridia bacterium]